MKTVGTFEAKTHLSQLLNRVAKGEQFLITSRGKPAAMLVPPVSNDRSDTAEVARSMLAFRDQIKRRLGASFRKLAHEGHHR